MQQEFWPLLCSLCSLCYNEDVALAEISAKVNAANAIKWSHKSVIDFKTELISVKSKAYSEYIANLCGAECLWSGGHGIN